MRQGSCSRQRPVTTEEMMRVRLAIVLVALLGAGAAAADVFQEYGLDRKAWGDAFVNSMTDGSLYAPAVSARLKAVAPAQRAAVVTALGAAAKGFFESAAFKAQYKTEYEAGLPDAPKPPRTAKQISDESRAEIEKGVKEMEASLKELTPELRKQMEPALALARAAMKEQIKNIEAQAAQLAAMEKAAYDKAKSEPAEPGKVPADPKVALRKALRRFLTESTAVDFDAQTRTEFRMKRFVRGNYESKPRTWKMCYRAGREACEAARTFATNWLAELE
jgi:hypothetical protein